MLLGLAAAAALLPTTSGSIHPSGASMPPSGMIEAGPQQVAVVDGETLRLRDVVVRLRGVLAPPRTGCRDGEADCGAAASGVLASLVRERSVRCDLSGRDAAGRPLGRCWADAVELNQAVLARGRARADPDTP